MFGGFLLMQNYIIFSGLNVGFVSSILGLFFFLLNRQLAFLLKNMLKFSNKSVFVKNSCTFLHKIRVVSTVILKLATKLSEDGKIMD